MVSKIAYRSILQYFVYKEIIAAQSRYARSVDLPFG